MYTGAGGTYQLGSKLLFIQYNEIILLEKKKNVFGKGILHLKGH